MDRFDELAVFVAIAETGSLNKAAKRLRRSAPTVTRTLAALERRIGARLIERTTRRLSLTEAGWDVAEQARALLGAYERATRRPVTAPIHGLLRITAPVQFGRRHVAPLVTRFLDDYPQMQVELVLHDRNLDLIDERLDVGFRIGVLADSSLVVRKIGEVRRVVIASPDYLTRRGTPQTPSDLASHDIIFGTVSSSGYEWQFGPDRRGLHVRLAPRLIISDVESVLAAACAGHGIARVLSYQAADDLRAGRLQRILAPFEPAPLPVQIVTASASYMAPKLRTFIDYTTDAMHNVTAIHDSLPLDAAKPPAPRPSGGR